MACARRRINDKYMCIAIVLFRKLWTKDMFVIQDEVATLTESSSNQLQEIDRLNSQLEQIDSLENNLKKERQKKKEQEKRIHQLEIDVADAVTELNKLKVRNR